MLKYHPRRLFHMQQTQIFSALLHKEGDWYVSCCSEMDLARQGKTVEEAISHLIEAVELYLED